jgi:hypothetical protein
MPEVGFQPTTTASKEAKTVHALDRSATVTGVDELTGNFVEPLIVDQRHGKGKGKVGAYVGVDV